MPKPAPPLSPHLQIYRWTLTMALSILHRATGIALYSGTLLLLLWLVALAGSGTLYHIIQTQAASWYGQVILCAYGWAFFHHLCGGLRHFIWDMGYGFNLPIVEMIARLAVIVPVVLTALCWLLAQRLMGGL